MGTDKFVSRHIGPRDHEIDTMLTKIGASSLEELIDQTVPSSIRLEKPLNISKGLTERQYFRKIHDIAQQNKVYNTYIGMGYYDVITPAVITRNVLENPVWYTSYTPYQAEISQGRLEALLNFQTVVTEMTGMELANASLLDEATAAAEAMIMLYNSRSRKQAKAGVNILFADENMWPQTKEVLITRAKPMGIELQFGDIHSFECNELVFGVMVQYPNSNGTVECYKALTEKVHANDCRIAVAADLMSLALLTPPGEWGADIVFGTTQRFGIPMGYGGPHAAFFATKESLKRQLPGRIIGVTKDVNGKRALRMALQTREQHIKRERATSNICTAQALLATMAGFYAVYHGEEGIKRIAERIHSVAYQITREVENLGYKQLNADYFDTIRFQLPEGVKVEDIENFSLDLEMNFRYFENGDVGISIDETTNLFDLNWIVEVFAKAAGKEVPVIGDFSEELAVKPELARTSPFLTQDVFAKYRSEAEMVRYIKKLERRDISLTHSMISLGSCTMKLNASTEMFPLSWIEFNGLHPFIPTNQALGYHMMMDELRGDLSEITGFADVSLQPNSGAAGEYAGLMVIQAYHESRGEGHRNISIIPASAHGTNPASAVMAGMKVVVVKCDDSGNIDVADLKAKAEEHKENLSNLMVTYPSTHGVFEESIIEVCQIIHDNGGQVYMDGANMNAQVGLTSPGHIGADVCHLNLHKTFAIPHGGGGPGVGPIGVAKHLVEFLPAHPVIDNGRKGITAVAAAPWGSASVLPITYGYIKMLGAEGLTQSTKMAILNANYMASELKDDYGILYTGKNGRVAHEMILECRHFKADSGITETDIAKRLMDYGFHAPTLSFPVYGTLMVEPTESESLQELDRFIAAMKSIYAEIKEVESGAADKEDNVLKNAPHPAYKVVSDEWTHSYGREKAAYPLSFIRENKFWIDVARVDDAYGDRNLVCACEPIESYMED
ncbi:aminomethyl-transferring glycine dehydrogenase [Carboxylicivirga marina]|uniref:Glycine dehydrogenase (decarboxylating) n=1 Tax=Carboxylicivirga marina TaxID=2800988 RepID=A0ABS1HH25_9BACT|nr:aminomethyl-transferring glycine dehydrogenase [Carboxylicivirga marina]MBK3516944.1 aminomethyl-transferring glycine dehydrogenase [Carboxylicivirga marina]